MDNWDATVVYWIASDRHQERIARGETAQRAAGMVERRQTPTIISAALLALAAWLDPACATARPGGRSTAHISLA